jgi:SAM-dependent methyltransferase
VEDYKKNNQLAWEESFNQRSDAFEQRTQTLLRKDPLGFFSQPLAKALTESAVAGTTIAQFCCNNGRETIASLAFGFSKAIGFDIAKNMVAFANKTAKELQRNATFCATDILAIPSQYNGIADVGLITVGALCWFPDLRPFFQAVAKVIKPKGMLIIEDMHPFTNLVAMQDEPLYRPDAPALVVYDYFKKEPWVSNEGMGYMTGGSVKTTTFSSFSHPFGEIVNSLVEAGFELLRFDESTTDQSDSFEHLQHTGLPLTFLLQAKRK